MIFNTGFNDMPRGWKSNNELNYRIYTCWHGMLMRCYCEKYQNKYPTYRGCYVCNRWLKLSNFVEDISKIKNYELWFKNPRKYALDKDIKSNGINKCYCLEECMFVTNKENTQQAVKTRKYKFTEEHKQNMSKTRKEKGIAVGKNNGMYGKHRTEQEKENRSFIVVRCDKNDNIIDIKYAFKYKDYGFNTGKIGQCCKNKLKSTGGYKWKYLSDVPEEDILNYIRHNMQVKIEEEY